MPAGPTPKTIVWLSMASTYFFWLAVLGLMVRPRPDRMFIDRTSAGREPSPWRSIPRLRSTASPVSTSPLASSASSCSNSSTPSALSLAEPVSVISLPRTWTSLSSTRSTVVRTSSRLPSRVTMDCSAGTTILLMTRSVARGDAGVSGMGAAEAVRLLSVGWNRIAPG